MAPSGAENVYGLKDDVDPKLEKGGITMMDMVHNIHPLEVHDRNKYAVEACSLRIKLRDPCSVISRLYCRPQILRSR